MGIRDSFELNGFQKGIGVRVLLVEFNDLDARDLWDRLEPLAILGLVNSVPLNGALWALESFQPRVVFVHLQERHIRGDSVAMEVFLTRLATLRVVTVIPIISKRVVIDHFRRHLRRVSPMYFSASFLQGNILHVFGSAFFQLRESIHGSGGARPEGLRLSNPPRIERSER